MHASDPEIRAAVMEGLEQADRGEGKPAEKAFGELRAKYGIPRWPHRGLKEISISYLLGLWKARRIEELYGSATSSER